ncbi:MAG: c-type cytochrome [Chitinophagaceae bacterium]|nr:c-type cytochrome [Chitinophagaceae bacterium]
MKKLAAAAMVLTFFYACGSGPQEAKAPISVSVNPQIGAKAPSVAATTGSGDGAQKPAAAAPAKDGKALIAASDCRACHSDKDKLVGPAYAEVAQKYKEKDIPALAKKIIDGGSGVWGPIPMAPHAALSTEDAEAMVKYILTIK